MIGCRGQQQVYLWTGLPSLRGFLGRHCAGLPQLHWHTEHLCTGLPLLRWNSVRAGVWLRAFQWRGCLHCARAPRTPFEAIILGTAGRTPSPSARAAVVPTEPARYRTHRPMLHRLGGRTPEAGHNTHKTAHRTSRSICASRMRTALGNPTTLNPRTPATLSCRAMTRCCHCPALWAQQQ